jgi:hypothetical protein
MLDGPVKVMVDRGNNRTDLKVPPYLGDRRQEALDSGRLCLVLCCSDPRLDPRKILQLDGTPGTRLNGTL